jgi:hypothetical protein
MEFYLVDPWDERRADLRDATNTSVMVNELRGLDNTVRVIASGLGAKMKLRRDVLHPRDLMPNFEQEEQSGEEAAAKSFQRQEREKALEYAARFHQEQQKVKALLGLGEGLRPGALEPVIEN